MAKVKYWKITRRRAWREALAFLFDSWARVAVQALLASIAMLLVIVALGTDAGRQRAELVVLLGVAPLLLLPGVFLWRWASLPPRLYKRERDRSRQLRNDCARLKDAAKPKIRIFLENEGVTWIVAKDQLPTGAILPGSSHMQKWIQFCVSGETNAPIDGCEARLLSIVRLADAQELVDEHIFCAWSNRPERMLTLQAPVVERANLFHFHPKGGPHCETVPIKFKLDDAIKTPGRYRIKIAVTGKGCPPAEATFVFEWNDFDHIRLEREV